MGDLVRRVSEPGQSVGILLATRRKTHMVSLSEMRRAADISHILDVDHAEDCADPLIESVRGWYTTFQTLVGGRASWQQLPYAERNQWYTTYVDAKLRDIAWHKSAQVAWWWAMVKNNKPRGAWCHLCSEMIYTYDTSAPMTHNARAAVMGHRSTHVSLYLQSQDTNTPEVAT